jgi:uncharacterized membrane protein
MKRTAKEFRDTAWKTLTGRYWWAVLAALVAGILGGYASGSSPSFNFRFSDVDLSHFGEWFQNVKLVFANTSILHWGVGLASALAASVFTIHIVFFLVGSAVELGFNLFNISLYTSRERPKFELLFSRFSIFGRALGLRILMFLKILAWTLLFIIPGIIAAYRYAMAPYLLAEHPDMTAMDAIELSKKMMCGNKGRLFCLQLSFIGWYLLAALTAGVGWLFLAPYPKAAVTAFYMELTGRLPLMDAAARPSDGNSATPPPSGEPPKPEDETIHTEWV